MGDAILTTFQNHFAPKAKLVTKRILTPRLAEVEVTMETI